jgi:predicted AAA+ superfamily ATPase
MELARQATWSNTQVDLFHYRDKDKREVDLILQDASGKVVGIEVKASTTVRGEDFKAMRHVARLAGSAWMAGIVLYAGNSTASFGDTMRAMPISAIWQTTAPNHQRSPRKQTP